MDEGRTAAAARTGGSVRSGSRSTTREELTLRAARAATALREEGAHGRAVALLMRNDVELLEAVFAAGFVGAQAVPLNWHHTPAELGYVLRDCGATHLVAHADLLHRLGDGLPPGVRPLCVPTPPQVLEAYDGIPAKLTSTPAGAVEWASWLAGRAPHPRTSAGAGGTMMYTSGTTGRPKGVRRRPLDPRRRAADAALRQRWFGNRPGMRTAIVGPLYHSVQLSYALAALAAPGELVMTSRFDAARLLALVESERLTHLHLVPTMMRRLLQLPEETRRRHDLSSLELVIHGSAPCPPDLKRALIDWLGPIVHEYYGTTEAGMVSRVDSEEWLARPGTVGRAWPGREVRIYDADGTPLPPGVEGDVYMSFGPMPDFTYHNADEARTVVERDGCITSGDIGYLDEDGYLFLCDRRTDVVVCGGVNVYPAEVEAVVGGHPDVLDCAVFGIPDDEFGERLMAVVQPRPGRRPRAAELRALAREQLAGFKVPRAFELRDELPRDESGKIARRQLREPYWAALGRRI